jgi:hypothetical protein
MTTRHLFVALIALLAACRSQPGAVLVPVPSASDSGQGIATGTAAMSMERPRQDIEHFRAAFPATDSAGVCGSLPPAALSPGGWGAFLVFSPVASAPRRVSVRYDSAGALTYYSDRRGEISLGRVVRQPDGSMRVVLPTGRRTEIDINFVTGLGLARNTGGDGPEEAYVGAPAQMLDAANLDYPRKTAGLVRELCH